MTRKNTSSGNSVTIREKSLKKGITLYLDIYHQGKRTYETLKDSNGQTLKLLSKPKNVLDRQYNKLAYSLAEKRKSEVEAELLIGKYSIDKQDELINADFIIFYKNCINKDSDSIFTSVYTWLKNNVESILFKDLTNEVIESWKVKMSETYKEQTIFLYMNRIKIVLNKAVELKIIKESPASEIKVKVNRNNQEIKYLQGEEITKLFSNDIGKEYKDDYKVTQFLYYTGLRISDVVNLKWEHIKKHNDITYIEKEIKKSTSFEKVTIHEEAVKILSELDKNNEFIFELGQGRLLKPEQCFTQRLIYYSTKNGGKKVTAHQLRHTAATEMINNGVDIYTVSKQLTHKDIKTTMRYAKVLLDKQNAAVNKIPTIIIKKEGTIKE
jgi:integrase